MSGLKYFDRIITAATRPVAREITITEQTMTVHVKRITAAERLSLLPAELKLGANQQANLTLKDMVEKQYRMVLLSIVTPDGKQVFANAQEVAKLPEVLYNELLKLANEINKEAEEAGKEELPDPSNDS